MSKRSTTMAAAIARMTAASEAAPAGKAEAPSLRHIAGAFDTLQRRAEQAASGVMVVDLSPDLIDPSPYSDRMIDGQEVEDLSLREKIETDGQLVPILVRPNPIDIARYQVAYGHRRLRACKALNRTVRAVVREMTDRELVTAQARENIERLDLTFFELARFALRLKNSGYDKREIPSILGLDRTEVSRMLTAGTAIPDDIADLLGRLPGIGRGRFLEIAGHFADLPMLAEAVRAENIQKPFSNITPLARVTAVTRIAHRLKSAPEENIAKVPSVLKRGPKTYAKLIRTPKGMRVDIADRDFADFLETRLPDLLEQFTLPAANHSSN